MRDPTDHPAQPCSPTPVADRLTGVVLAGGVGRRMGADKALVVLDGERLVDRAVRCLSALCRQVVVARGERSALAGLGVPQLPDAAPRAGPLGGVLAGLEAAEHARVVVVGVDFPHLDPGVVRLLVRHASARERGVVAPVVADLPQPLYAVWHRADAEAVRHLLPGGAGRASGAGHVARLLGLQLVAEHSWRAVATGPGPAWNVNRPDDLLRAGGD